MTIKHPLSKLGILIILLIMIAFVSLMVGYTNYSTSDVIHCICHDHSNFAIYDIRLPRLIMGTLCGIMFAFSGNLFQVIFKNQLASSETLGINASSVLFVLFGITLFNTDTTEYLLLYSIIGALFGFSITLFASITNNKISPFRLIVIGIAIGSLFRAGSQLMLISQDQKLAAYIAFVNGTLYNTTYDSIQVILLPALVLIAVSFCITKQLDVLLLSDEVSHNIGFNVTLWKIATIVLALLLTSTAVAGVGSLGFIGLIAPNISRLLFGYSHKYNLLGTAIIGALLTILSDTIGRIILIPFEIPSGLIGIIIGVPYFIYIMRTMRSNT